MNLGKGVYNFPEASRLAKTPVTNVRRWMLGRSDAPGSGPVLCPDYMPQDGKSALSFLDLIDLLVVGRFREEGVSLQTVRKVYKRLVTLLNTPHPFAHRALLTDGRTVFLESLTGVDTASDHELEEVLTGQRAMPEVLRPYLTRIEYRADNLLAGQWNIAAGVLIHPDRCFGKPVVVQDCIATRVLAMSYRANCNNEVLVADLFNTTPASVLAAVEFESGLASARAA